MKELSRKHIDIIITIMLEAVVLFCICLFWLKDLSVLILLIPFLLLLIILFFQYLNFTP